jgi:DNA-binding transcriptional MerR regulator
VQGQAPHVQRRPREDSGASSSTLTIGEVLTELQDEFPKVAASKLRFLEERGLVHPTRTPAGYRKFTADDVERLRFVLTVQRDQFLPLKVIREHLDALDRGESPEPLPGGHTLAGPAGAAAPVPTARRLTAEELGAAHGLTPAALADLERFALLPAPDAQGTYPVRASEVLAAVATLAEQGLEPRHLRPVRAAADREVGLVEQAVAPLATRRDEDSRTRAAETARRLGEAMLTLHAALVEDGLDALDGGPRR